MPEHHVSTLYMLRKKDAFTHHHAGRLRAVDVELPAPKCTPSATARVQWRQLHDALAAMSRADDIS
jgi:hypothetical protein